MENEQNYDAAWEENKTGADIAWQWEPVKQLVEVGAHRVYSKVAANDG